MATDGFVPKISSVHFEKVIHTYDHNKVMWQSAQQEKYAAYAKNLFCVLKLCFSLSIIICFVKRNA